MFKRKKHEEAEAGLKDAPAEQPEPVSEDNPLFGGAAVDNHKASAAPASPETAAEPASQAGAVAPEGAPSAAGTAPKAEEPATADEWRAGEAEDFARPRPFEVEADDVPTREDDRDEVTGMPFDADGAFAYDADAEEFGAGDSDSFLDDPQRDYYRYGDKMHNVRQTAEDEAYEEEQAVEQAAHAQAEVEDVPAVDAPRGKHRKPTKKERLDAAPEHVRKSHRTRRMLIVVVIALVIVLGLIAFWAFSLYRVNNETAVQQVSSTTTDVNAVSSGDTSTSDSSTENTKVTEVPALVSLMGLTQDQAIAALGHGATATVSTPVEQEGNPVATSVTVLLSDEPADAKSGTPTVYLGLNADGAVVQAGYSAATASLGYGNLSFIDIINNEHVVENTLDDAGLNVQAGSVEAPQDKLSYTTYASDGKTVTAEKCSFDGSDTVNGANYTWSAAVSYDYTAQIASGDYNDTVRQITVYITAA